MVISLPLVVTREMALALFLFPIC